jgi:hypothetical protein
MGGGYRIPDFNHLPHLIPAVTPSSDGVMSSEDKTSLNNLLSYGVNAPSEIVQLVSGATTSILTIDFSKVPDLSSAIKIRYAVECTDGGQRANSVG